MPPRHHDTTGTNEPRPAPPPALDARLSSPDSQPSTLNSQPSTLNPAGRVVTVMPAYNAAATLERTLADIPPGSVDEIILVDDGSTDGTVELARGLARRVRETHPPAEKGTFRDERGQSAFPQSPFPPLRVVQHPRNLGYGANQKTCYRLALAAGADYVVMIHPDYQYDARVIPLAVGFLRLGICDVVVGSRIRTRAEALDGGMPLYKYIANRLLTVVENVALGQNLGDFHSGFRAYRRAVLETIPFERNSDDFVFDTQFLVQAVHFGFKLGDVPVPVRYFDEASSISFRRSLTYGLRTLGTVGAYWLHRWGARRSRLFVPRK